MRLLIGLGFNATSMQKNDSWQALSLCRETGLRFVELTAGISASAMIRVDYKTKELLGIRHQLRQDGISVCAIGAHRDLSREESLHQFLTLLSHAANIGCPIVTTGIPDGCNEDAFSDGLYQAACRAESLGITICLETHGYEHGTGVSLLPFTRIHPSVMICYDTGNVLYYSNSDPAEDLPECLSAVRHVHLKDKIGGKGVWNFPAAGEGIVPFETLCKALEQQSKLSASIEIEFTPEGVTLPETRKALAKSVQYFRSLSPMQFDS